MNRTITYQISGEESGLRVEQFLRRKGYSRQNLAELKKPVHETLINGKPCHLNQPLCADDALKVCIHETSGSEKIKPEKIPLSILYEDEDLLVVNKPAGLPIHPSRNNDHYSLANALAAYYQLQHQSFIFRCINRLDRDTSGLTLIAKHFVSASILSSLRAERKLTKEYLAIACGSVTPAAGTIDAPLSRKPGRIIEQYVDFEHGRPAVTHYQVLAVKNGCSLVSLKLETGRTHQIRIHMQYLGYPLAGDPLYHPLCRAAAASFSPESGLAAYTVPKEISGISRQALHAWRLCFPHPITGKALCFTAPLPEDMREFFPESL